MLGWWFDNSLCVWMDVICWWNKNIIWYLKLQIPFPFSVKLIPFLLTGGQKEFKVLGDSEWVSRKEEIFFHSLLKVSPLKFCERCVLWSVDTLDNPILVATRCDLTLHYPQAPACCLCSPPMGHWSSWTLTPARPGTSYTGVTWSVD